MDSKNIVSVAFQLTLFGSLYFGPLAASSLSLAFSMILFFRSPVNYLEIVKLSQIAKLIRDSEIISSQ